MDFIDNIFFTILLMLKNVYTLQDDSPDGGFFIQSTSMYTIQVKNIATNIKKERCDVLRRY